MAAYLSAFCYCYYPQKDEHEDEDEDGMRGFPSREVGALNSKGR
jgi:hypothetical protein